MKAMTQALMTLFSVLFFLSPLHIGSVSCESDPCATRNPEDFANYNPSSGITWLNTPYNFGVQAEAKAGFSVGYIKAVKSGATIFYTIASDPQNLFVVVNVTGELTLKNDIDERQAALGTNQFCTSFFAFSGSSQSQIGVGLYRDTNQNAPTFTNSSYNLVLPEDQSLGTVVFRVGASDVDTGEDGRLTYRITSGNADRIFSLNATSGELSLAQRLDYETAKAISLLLLATDNGRIPRSGSATIHVRVTDVNDNAPYFAQPTYSTSVLENSTVGSSILTMSATDRDTGLNVRLIYSLQNSNQEFYIDSFTGILFVNHSLDYETRKSYAVTVIVTDSKFDNHTSVFITIRNVDECRLATCYNGGTCVEGHSTYTCLCALGFTDDRCETNFDECNSRPCQNSGICLDGVESFICLCHPGFTGSYCQTDVDECEPSPCQNDRMCTDIVNGYVCECPTGFTGVTCATNIDECSSMPCMNQGKCADGIAGYNCSCLDGYTGIHCERNIDECLSEPCRHGATCLDEVNHYTCFCADGHTGLHCETNYDECSSEPCLHNSTCVDGVDFYQCLCGVGYTGAQCEVDIQSSPCQYGETGTDIVNGYQCNCSGGNRDVDLGFESVGEVNRNYLLIAFLCFLGGLLIGILGMAIPYRMIKKQLVRLEERLRAKTHSDHTKMTVAPGYRPFLQPPFLQPLFLQQFTADLTDEVYEIPDLPADVN
ncbi:uncharacterized protein [Oscarella lobularis]|uniref:uncharacterized protein isoform X1 n=2 Tax=Oscarella lobularis TaxID=121494 RepID=UPI003313BB80